jgi:hypothetical protein
VIGAEFLHNSSRALDPQLHTHFTFFNATFDQQEQRCKALQTFDLFDVSQYGTEIYRNELVRRLNAIGYEVHPTSTGFDIDGVSPELIERFSKRSQERDKVVAEMEQRLGRELSNNEVSIAVHQTRSRKLKGITSDEVWERQRDQLSPAELASLQAVKDRADGFRISTEPIPEKAALDLASAHLFERSSVVPQEELLRQALIAGRGQMDLAQLKSTLQSSPEFIRVGQTGASNVLVSTREILGSELFLVQTLNQGKDSCPALAKSFVPGPHLGSDQKEALVHVINCPDQFTGLRGLAGTGKTTTLSELSRALTDSGHSTLFCAPTAAATDVLRKDGFAAVTLAKLIHDKEVQSTLGKDSVIVLDEAGLVGTGDMKALFELVSKSGSRVVFSGDTGQHASVSRGDALRILEDHSQYSFRKLSTIRRQQAEQYRSVVELAAAQHPQAAFDELDQLGWVHELSSQGLSSAPALYEKAAAAYLESRANGKSALLIAPTWSEIDSVTAAVRKQLKKDLILGAQEVSVPVFDSLSWTDAQKRQVSHYVPGQRIVFGQDSGSFKQHEQIEVLLVDHKKNALQVRREDGSKHLFRPRTGTSFDVGEARQIGVAPGDLLLLQANRVKEGIINGQVGTVRSVENGQITLTDGRVLPPDYRQFSHGYCVTSHSAQARTVDAVMLVASSRSAAAIHQEQFYVSISRGRQECQVFTDDKELLRHRVSHSSQRQAALELLGEALTLQGYSPPSLNVSEPVQAPNLAPLNNLSHLEEQVKIPLHQFMANVSIQTRERIDFHRSHEVQDKDFVPTPPPFPTPEVNREKTKEKEHGLSF